MDLFDAHSDAQSVLRKGLAQTVVYTQNKDCEICNTFKAEQKKQLATSTYSSQKENKKKASPPAL